MYIDSNSSSTVKPSTWEASLVYRVSRPLGHVETGEPLPTVFSYHSMAIAHFCEQLWFRHCTPGSTPEAEEVLVFSGDLNYLVVCVCIGVQGVVEYNHVIIMLFNSAAFTNCEHGLVPPSPLNHPK